MKTELDRKQRLQNRTAKTKETITQLAQKFSANESWAEEFTNKATTTLALQDMVANQTMPVVLKLWIVDLARHSNSYLIIGDHFGTRHNTEFLIQCDEHQARHLQEHLHEDTDFIDCVVVIKCIGTRTKYDSIISAILSDTESEDTERNASLEIGEFLPHISVLGQCLHVEIIE